MKCVVYGLVTLIVLAGVAEFVLTIRDHIRTKRIS